MTVGIGIRDSLWRVILQKHTARGKDGFDVVFVWCVSLLRTTGALISQNGAAEAPQWAASKISLVSPMLPFCFRIFRGALPLCSLMFPNRLPPAFLCLYILHSEVEQIVGSVFPLWCGQQDRTF